MTLYFTRRPSVRPSVFVRPSVRPCSSVRPSVCLLVTSLENAGGQGRTDLILEVIRVWLRIWELFEAFFNIARWGIFPHFGSHLWLRIHGLGIGIGSALWRSAVCEWSCLFRSWQCKGISLPLYMISGKLMW